LVETIPTTKALIKLLSKQELHWLQKQNIGEISSITQFEHALTNDVYLVINQVNNRFVFKRLNQQARSVNDRKAELLVQNLVSQYNLTPKVLAHNSAYKLQQFIEGSLITTGSKQLPKLLANQLIRIHQLPVEHAPKQRLFFELQQLKSQLKEPVDEKRFAAISELAEQLDSSCPFDTLCHGDLSENNVLLGDDNKIYVIDWEYAVIACPAYDLAFCYCINEYSDNNIKQLIETYYQQLLSPLYSLESLQKECQLYFEVFRYINELWAICFLEK